MERSTTKTQFKVERSVLKAFLFLVMGRKTLDSWPQHRAEWDGIEKQSFSRGATKSTLKHKARNTRKSESVPKPPSLKVFDERSAQSAS